MNKFLDAIQGWAVVILLLLSLLLGWATDHYQTKARAATDQLTALQDQVKRQNDEAEKTLQDLTDQRDAAQARLDAAHQQQEATDAANQQEIARLAGELEQRPVRVRIVPQPAACGSGGGGAAGDAAASADASAADPAEAYGLLPAGNAARLGRLITEIETINAAYASCRASLMHQ